MELTSLAKDSFYNWLVLNSGSIFKDAILGDEEDLYDEYNTMPLVCRNALIIQWLDISGIIIDINSEYYDGYHFWWEINISKAERSESGFETRTEALQSAINRANEIYNASNNSI